MEQLLTVCGFPLVCLTFGTVLAAHALELLSELAAQANADPPVEVV